MAACPNCTVQQTIYDVGHSVLVLVIALTLLAVLRKHTFLGDWGI